MILTDWRLLRNRDGVNYVTPARLAVDLLTLPGRGPAEGEELLRVLDAR